MRVCMDEQMYIERVTQCEASMYRVARSILWNDTDCADAVQQAVFKGWINRGQLRDEVKFKQWILRILVNECRNLQRRSLRQKNLVAAIGNRLKTACAPVRNEALEDAVRALPEEYRLPIVLHYREGYPIKEIAMILDVPEKRVSERMYRARRKLEEAMKR